MQTPLSLTPDQLAALSAGSPVSLIFGETQVTLNPPERRAGRRFNGLDDLSSDVMAPVDFTCEFKPGQAVTFRIKALDALVAKECDDIGADVRPPKKKIPAQGPRGTVTEELDWEDKDFLARRSQVNSLRTAFVLTRGLVDFEIPGETLEEKSKNLRAKLPPRVTEALFAAITGLTSDPVKQADFS